MEGNRAMGFLPGVTLKDICPKLKESLLHETLKVDRLLSGHHSIHGHAGLLCILHILTQGGVASTGQEPGHGNVLNTISYTWLPLALSSFKTRWCGPLSHEAFPNLREKVSILPLV